MSLEEALNALLQLKVRKSSKEKVEFIKSEYKKDSESHFINVLKFLLDDSITSGISKSKMKYINDKFESEGLDSLLKTNSCTTLEEHLCKLEKCTITDILEYISVNNTGRIDDLMVVRLFISQNIEWKEVLEAVFTKRINLGITAKTINKTIPDFIEVIEFMKAKNYIDRYELGKFDFNKKYIISEKIDGVRCAIIKKSRDDIKAYSRQGKEIKGLVDIINGFRSDVFDIGVYDGELLSLGEFETDEMRFQHTCSIVNSKAERKTNVEFIIFDNIEIDGFFKGYSDIQYMSRFMNLSDKVDMYLKNGGKYITSTKYKKYFRCENVTHDSLMKLVEQCDKDGKEGVMINDIYSSYKAGRVDGILKLKKTLVADVRIIGFEKGDGKHQGRLGALVVEFEYKGVMNRCNIGTGFSDDERVEFWENKEKYLGKIIEVKYQKITKNKTDNGYSLGFASYNHRIRHDKNETNI